MVAERFVLLVREILQTVFSCGLSVFLVSLLVLVVHRRSEDLSEGDTNRETDDHGLKTRIISRGIFAAACVSVQRNEREEDKLTRQK